MTNRTDNFNRTDTTSNIGTPSDGGSAWSQVSGTWGIASNQGYESGGGGQRVCALESSVADGDVQVTAAVVSDDIGIVARLADNSNYLLVLKAVGTFFMYAVVGGGFNFIGAAGGSLSNGDVLKFSVSGSTLNVYVNGSLVLGPITDSSGSTNTQHGLRTHANTAPRFDVFSFTGAGGGGGSAFPWHHYQQMAA